jgi:hypothetical protein
MILQRSMVCAAVLFFGAASCGDDGDGRTARVQALAKAGCEHRARCHASSFAEDFAGQADCVPVVKRDIEDTLAEVTKACGSAYLDLGECEIQDCEDEDEDCRALEDKVEAVCSDGEQT